MPDPSHRPYDPMTIIKPDTMPRLWWLNPWAAARYLHSAATALKDYADQADRCIEMQIRIIEDKNLNIDRLQAQVERLTKAGDALAYRYATALSAFYGDGTEEDAMDILNNPDGEELVNWLAAKEGKGQP